MKTRLVIAPDGLLGFDANSPLTPRTAAIFKESGYRFTIRYVRRAAVHSYDISKQEVEDILSSGLGLMLVQHVAPDGWRPSAVLGAQYGRTAAQESIKVGYPEGGILWCDLEGVARDVPALSVVDYCNTWYQHVKAGGFEPGLYVGYACGLSAERLYRDLQFSRYWSAYNLNGNSFPAIRGVQMKQGPFPGRAALPDIPFEYDTNVTNADKKGDRVILCVPSDCDIGAVPVPQPTIAVPPVSPPAVQIEPPVVPTPPMTVDKPKRSWWRRIFDLFR